MYAQTQGRDKKCYLYVSNKEMLRSKKIFYGNSKSKTDKEETGTTVQEKVVPTQ